MIYTESFFAKEIMIEKLSNVDLSRFTTFRTGGIAKTVFLPKSLDDIMSIRRNCDDLIILGGMSNVLVSDETISTPIMRLARRYKEIDTMDYKDYQIIDISSGFSSTKLSFIMMQKGLSGFEFGYGLPGSIGGAVKMNAGAYQSDISNIFDSCEVITKDGQSDIYHKDDMRFGYRRSIIDDDTIISRVRLKLFKADKARIKKKMEDIYNMRKASQPLSFPSAGSIFKNSEMLYAGKLIDDLGLKGERINGASVSKKHANFIINDKGCRSSDIYNLIKKISTKVYNHYGIKLELEIKLIGAFD